MKSIWIALFILSPIYVSAQNLVINPSFEDTIPCALYQGPPQMTCYAWFLPTAGSSDYFNVIQNCFNTSPIPNNGFGFQYPLSGSAYVGIGTYRAPYFLNPSGREYVEGILIDTLSAGHDYCVSFYAVAADNCRYIVDAIGAHLSIDSVFEPLSSIALTNYVPQITNASGSILSDTLNWTLIAGIYTAQGGEKYITIGNFYDNSNTNIDSLNNNPPLGNYGAYYYIDDVSVVDCTTGIEEIKSQQLQFNIAPNPVIDKLLLQLQNTISKNYHIEIFNTMGSKVSEQTFNKNSLNIDVSRFDAGVYFVKVSDAEGLAGVKRFVRL